MKILVLNGSPRGNRSASLKVARAFLSGYGEVIPSEIETVELGKLRISDCRGCLCCWKKESGRCVISDDMQSLLEKVLASDIIVEVFPLYFFTIPSRLKAFTDRCIALTSAYRGSHGDGVNEHFIHSMRYPELYEKKLILVSTCGYEFTDDNYNAVTDQYDRICGKGNYLSLFCPQGGVLSEQTLRTQVDRYLLKFASAGKEYAENGSLSAETLELLKKPLLRHHAFEAALNRTWDTDAGPYGNSSDTEARS